MGNKLRVFEAFAGVGSQRMALRNLGIDHEVVGICEIDKYALKSYEAIHGDCKNFGDISKIETNDLPDMDLFTYSFPCQDLSVVGKQAGLGKGTRSGLLYECEKIIENKKPKYLLLENVKNLVGKKFKGDFDEWLKYLEGLGYTNYWKVLNAKDYGVPQNRERVFVVSILNDTQGFEFKEKIELNKFIRDILEEYADGKYYINKKWHFTKNNEQKHNEGEIAKIDEIRYAATRSISDINKICRCLDTMRGGQREPKILIHQATKKGYIEMELGGVCDLTYPNSKTRRGRVQEGGSICPTLTAASQDIVRIEYKGSEVELPCIAASRGRNPENTSDRTVGAYTEQILEINTKCTSNTITTVQKDNYAIEENYRVRKLTPLECWRLMGFKDEDFYKAKNAGLSNSQLYKQAGNSIVVNVLEGIFENLFINTKSKVESDLIEEQREEDNNIQFKWCI